MKRRQLFFSLPFLFGVARSFAQHPETGDSHFCDVDQLVTLLRTQHIGRIEILHVSDAILTFADLMPEALRRMCKYKVIIKDPWELPKYDALITSLQKMKVPKAGKPGDLRWAILFFDSDGKERSAVFWDRFGTHGICRDVPLSLDGRLLAWARETIKWAFLPQAAKTG